MKGYEKRLLICTVLEIVGIALIVLSLFLPIIVFSNDYGYANGSLFRTFLLGKPMPYKLGGDFEVPFLELSLLEAFVFPIEADDSFLFIARWVFIFVIPIMMISTFYANIKKEPRQTKAERYFLKNYTALGMIKVVLGLGVFLAHLFVLGVGVFYRMSLSESNKAALTWHWWIPVIFLVVSVALNYICDYISSPAKRVILMQGDFFEERPLLTALFSGGERAVSQNAEDEQICLLRQYHELLESGAITVEEFEKKKSEILNSTQSADDAT